MITHGTTLDVSTLVIGTRIAPLMVPTATIAEVVPHNKAYPIPGTQPWVLGFILWRGLPVPVISFEAMIGAGPPNLIPSRMVVLYPLPGREENDFFAIAASGEPHCLTVGYDALPVPLPFGLAPDFVSGALRYGNKVVVIPNFEAFAKAFYS